jgi:hypothetical protein
MTVISLVRDVWLTLHGILSDKVLIALSDDSEDPYEIFTCLSAEGIK